MKKLKLAFKAFFDIILKRVGNVDKPLANAKELGRQLNYKASLDINKKL